jgi:hypothetical protein
MMAITLTQKNKSKENKAKNKSKKTLGETPESG